MRDSGTAKRDGLYLVAALEANDPLSPQRAVNVAEAEVIVFLKVMTNCHTRDVGGAVWNLRGDKSSENRVGRDYEKVELPPKDSQYFLVILRALLSR